MTVFIVIWVSPQYDDHVVGVFSSKDKAEASLAGADRDRWLNSRIMEWQMDKLEGAAA